MACLALTSVLGVFAAAPVVGQAADGELRGEPAPAELQMAQPETLFELSAAQGLPSSEVSAVLRDSSGFLWFGTDRGLSRWDGHRFLSLHHEAGKLNSLSSDRVRLLFEDGSGHLWVGTDTGLDRLDRRSLSFRRYPKAEPGTDPPDLRMTAIAEDDSGGFWVGTRGGLFRFDPGSRSFSLVQGFRGVSISVLGLCRNGKLWVGSERGLNGLEVERGEAGALITPSFAEDLGAGGVADLAFGADGRLWIATATGLAEAELGRPDLLSLSPVGPLTALATSGDRIFATHAEGLLVFDGRRDGAVAGRRPGTPTRTARRWAPPVRWIETGQQGLIWIGHESGVSGFRIRTPAVVAAEPDTPRVVLTGLTMEGQRLRPGASPVLPIDLPFLTRLDLPAGSRMVVIDLAALAFEQRGHLRYTYRLLGLHEHWQETGGEWAQAIYSSLEPGSYELEARAAFDDGPWGETRRLEILVAPPSRPLGAFALYLLLGSAVILIGWRLRASHRRRDQAVTVRLRELQQQKLESLATLAGGVAHDFNNLLVGIFGHAELAKMEVGAESPAAKHLERILASARRAAELAKQMLFYSGRGNFVIEPLDASELVREVGDSVRPNLPDHVRLLVEPHPRLPRIEGDPGQLRQVLSNLINNASEALEERDGFIVIGTGLRTVDESFLEAHHLSDKLSAGDYVVITVDDTGSGIEEQALEKIFDPFFSTRSAGRGLGLAAAQGIARGHGGVLRVSSTPGRGSTFQLLLPVMASVEPSGSHGALPVLGARGAVLVVDGEREVRGVARGYLEKLGLDVFEASDRASALALFSRHRDRISLVLLDISSGGEGLETLRRLRNLEPALPVVLAGSLPASEAEERYRRHQPSGYVEKPFQLAHLQNALRENVPTADVN